MSVCSAGTKVSRVVEKWRAKRLRMLQLSKWDVKGLARSCRLNPLQDSGCHAARPKSCHIAVWWILCYKTSIMLRGNTCFIVSYRYSLVQSLIDQCPRHSRQRCLQRPCPIRYTQTQPFPRTHSSDLPSSHPSPDHHCQFRTAHVECMPEIRGTKFNQVTALT